MLVESWTGSLAAGLLSGSLFAFNTHTLTRLAHIQGIHLYGLPLALLALDRLMRAGSRRAALALAVWLSVLAYTSGYLVVFAAVMIAVVLVARLPEWWPRARQVADRTRAGGASRPASRSLPVYLPYRRAAREQHMVRTST